MIIRKYTTADCPAIAQLFYDTVHRINIRDYSEEQVNVWANGRIDLGIWNQSFLSHYTVVAEAHLHEKTQIVGFGDMDAAGYLDRLYIHADFQGNGAATAICDALEEHIHADVYTTHASITAKPFFEKRGYKEIKRQQVSKEGILLTNYIMEKKNL